MIFPALTLGVVSRSDDVIRIVPIGVIHEIEGRGIELQRSIRGQREPLVERHVAILRAGIKQI